MNGRISRLSRPPKHHFFGYYGMPCWNRSQRYHLALETDFHERNPTALDRATVGLIDMESGEFKPYARTRAFNFQQGSMMHWIDVGFGEEFTFNDWTGDKLVTRALDPGTSRVRTLQGAIAAVSPGQEMAIGLDFRRMFQCRRVVGYAVAPPATLEAAHPANDGLYLIDLKTGECQLLVSIAEVLRAKPDEETRAGPAWLNHVYFSPDGKRLLFVCRIKGQSSAIKYTSLWTVGVEGSDLRCLLDYHSGASHFAWIDSRRILCSTRALAGRMQFVTLFDAVGGGEIKPMGKGAMPPNGHACYSPDRRWLAVDAELVGPARVQGLMIYRPSDNAKVTLGIFPHADHFRGDIRCDLHPRWSPDGLLVSFDSVHEGSRQIYVAQVADIVQ